MVETEHMTAVLPANEEFPCDREEIEEFLSELGDIKVWRTEW